MTKPFHEDIIVSCFAFSMFSFTARPYFSFFNGRRGSNRRSFFDAPVSSSNFGVQSQSSYTISQPFSTQNTSQNKLAQSSIGATSQFANPPLQQRLADKWSAEQKALMSGKQAGWRSALRSASGSNSGQSFYDPEKQKQNIFNKYKNIYQKSQEDPNYAKSLKYGTEDYMIHSDMQMFNEALKSNQFDPQKFQNSWLYRQGYLNKTPNIPQGLNSAGRPFYEDNPNYVRTSNNMVVRQEINPLYEQAKQNLMSTGNYSSSYFDTPNSAGGVANSINGVSKYLPSTNYNPAYYSNLASSYNSNLNALKQQWANTLRQNLFS